MLSEAELILVALTGACALLVLGTIRLIWPAKPRDPVFRPRPGAARPTAPATVARDVRKDPAGATPAPVAGPNDRAPIGLRVQGRYRIVGELGASAFGQVCLAHDEATGHRVAIRFLPRSLVGPSYDAQAIQRVGRSIVAASTSHLGLVRVREFGETDDGRLFAAMELVAGRRLSEILSAGPLDVGTALRLALDLSGPVETLHNMGLVHGALRPCNVLVLEDGHVMLMDVELAGLRDARAPDGVIAAKPPAEYRSPEQIRRAPVSEKTDVYAFAVILYEMLCGVPPFRASTRESVLVKHLAETPEPMRLRRREVPGSVERIVAQALDKQPEQRPLIQDVINLLKVEASGARDKRVRVRRLFHRLNRWVERARSRRPPSDLERLNAPIERQGLLRQSLVAKEHESEGLQGELGELRRSLGALQGELERLRGERIAMAGAISAVVDLVGQLQRPMDEIARRLRTR